MCIERNGRATVAELVTHDQVGDRLHSVFAHTKLWNREALNFVALCAEQCGRLLGGRIVVARRCVGRYAHDLAKKLDLFCLVGVDVLRDGLFGGHGVF